MELADEVVAALESEQRRSDASAERRRFAMERRNTNGRPDRNHHERGGSQVLGRPPMGVPPLIWAMDIHLVSLVLGYEYARNVGVEVVSSCQFP